MKKLLFVLCVAFMSSCGGNENETNSLDESSIPSTEEMKKIIDAQKIYDLPSFKDFDLSEINDYCDCMKAFAIYKKEFYELNPPEYDKNSEGGGEEYLKYTDYYNNLIEWNKQVNDVCINGDLELIPEYKCDYKKTSMYWEEKLYSE
tara:strand:- start:250 stop:690 length:441 start_codon:yes stop_codon:yes gene_type:complete